MHMTVISGSERRRRWSAAEREEIVLASFALGAVIAEIARQFDVSTSLIYKWRRDVQQSTAMFVPAVMAEDEASMPDVLRDGRADSPVIRLKLAGGTTMSIAATAPARLVLAVTLPPTSIQPEGDSGGCFGPPRWATRCI